jgi:hypothetical protein
MGAGALAGFTIDFQVKATNVNNFRVASRKTGPLYGI